MNGFELECEIFGFAIGHRGTGRTNFGDDLPNAGLRGQFPSQEAFDHYPQSVNVFH